MEDFTKPLLDTVRVISFAYVAFTLQAQVAVRPPVRPTQRILGKISEERRVTLSGNRHPLAQPRYFTEAASPGDRMERMILSLKADEAQEAALESLLDSQYRGCETRCAGYLPRRRVA